MRSGISPGMWIDRICRLPSAIVLERTQKPSAIRQQSVACWPSLTTDRSAAYGFTEMGKARISLTSSSDIPDEIRNRWTSAARIASLDTGSSDFRANSDLRIANALGQENPQGTRPVPTNVRGGA